ncbi:Crp/Fnr family transcriptional regulator [Chitinophaga sp. sic0106]|uniref:Crp/Fnr family transcriptional regulator n=1 Tax=Chitinophaga sp. sic0106 TaxID=2854785 RepID=UPI001C4548BC|nr:Crp/Fnr family transcriptional regulator [Chitinophaga sp. sic0106]MBV7531098.1 Crp/Fnr family transcriptional regulator [Chitinophaga sp. sic0106]
MHELLITQMSYLIRLSEEEKEWIRQVFAIKTYEKGEYFLREGQVCREAGFIVEGMVRYVLTRDDGEELTVDFNKEMEYTCNYASFLDKSPSETAIQCIEPTTIIVISYDDLQEIYARFAEGQKFGRLICEFLYVQAIKKVQSLYTNEPEKRYLQFMDVYSTLVPRLPQYYISSYVGVKPPSLSRIRKRLAK